MGLNADLDDDVRHAVTDVGRCCRVPLVHLLGQLHMGRLVLVVLRLLRQALQPPAQGQGRKAHIPTQQPAVTRYVLSRGQRSATNSQ